ncbi:MAG: hypothetical protein E6K93_02085 [Thaumarchaeota archaeon]|nr:MAG: hypothetical protein E6K93_02085 [Nitrososphaerota archaeon]
MTSVHKNKQEVPNQKRKRSITINTILEEKLREIQSQLIGSTKTSWSLSMIVNVLITSGLLALDKLSREDFRIIKHFIESNKVTFDNKAIRDCVVQIIKD